MAPHGRRMNGTLPRWLRALLGCGVLSLAVGVTLLGSQVFGADIDAQVRDIAAVLRCPTCQALSVQDSPSEMAQQIRGLIREQLEQGKSREEIIAYFVERYGEWILLAPKATGFNLLIWVLPPLAIVAGVGGVVLVLRRWARQGRAGV